MREYRDFGAWYKQVERQIRFWPDRKAIHKELADHYWDHVRDLQRVGYEPELSYRRGLRAMGDQRKWVGHWTGPTSPGWAGCGCSAGWRCC